MASAFSKVETRAPLGAVPDEWDMIKHRRHALIVERRRLPFDDALIVPWLEMDRWELRREGRPKDLLRDEQTLPRPITNDITALGERFARLMNVKHVRLRLETVVTNACRKIHADNTDVRLICTYAGPGTEYLADPSRPDRLERLGAGWVGLFKGRTFAAGHEPAYHRSPPIAGTGIRRLLVVIDTPLSAHDAALLSSTTLN